MQYLYLIKCQQFYKIGITNDVESRLAQLSTGNPFELEVLAVYGFANAQAVENTMHQRFANTQQRGEWFALTNNDVAIFGQICQLLDGEIPQVVPTVGNTEIEEAEALAEPTDGAKWDFSAMFADGWRMAASDSRKRYWTWRKGSNNDKCIYGGLVSDLPYPLDDMRRVYRDGLEPFNPINPNYKALATVGDE